MFDVQYLLVNFRKQDQNRLHYFLAVPTGIWNKSEQASYKTEGSLVQKLLKASHQDSSVSKLLSHRGIGKLLFLQRGTDRSHQNRRAAYSPMK